MNGCRGINGIRKSRGSNEPRLRFVGAEGFEPPTLCL